MKIFTSKIIIKEKIANNIFRLCLEKPIGFKFKAGQFIQVIFLHEKKEVLRSYSISSTPDDHYMELCIKLLDTGVGSNFFKQCKIGDKITFRQANGRFVIDNNKEKNIFFIATGAGLAPIISMIEDELNKKINQLKSSEDDQTVKQLHLLFGVRYETDIFWKERLNKLAKKYKNFTYDITLSRGEKSWAGKQGRVSEHIPKNVKDFDFYLCGSPAMVTDVRKILLDKGKKTEEIFFEIF